MTTTIPARERRRYCRDVIAALVAAALWLLIGGVLAVPAANAATAGATATVTSTATGPFADYSHTAWAHQPGPFAELMDAGWTGNVDFAIEDVSPERPVLEWGSTGQAYYLADIIRLINDKWPLNSPATLYVTGYHEVNGNWFSYGDTCRAAAKPCQMSPAVWAKEIKAQYTALKAGLRPDIHLVRLLGLNYGSTVKISQAWYRDAPTRWLQAAASTKVPYEGIGVSMYQRGTAETFAAFKRSTWQNQAACVRAHQALTTCRLQTGLGPDSWAELARQWHKPLVWREWGALTATWRDAAKRYLSAAIKQGLVRDEAYLYDQTRKAVHYT